MKYAYIITAFVTVFASVSGVQAAPRCLLKTPEATAPQWQLNLPYCKDAPRPLFRAVVAPAPTRIIDVPVDKPGVTVERSETTPLGKTETKVTTTAPAQVNVNTAGVSVNPPGSVITPLVVATPRTTTTLVERSPSNLYPEMNAYSILEKCGVPTLTEATRIANEYPHLWWYDRAFISLTWSSGWWYQACVNMGSNFPGISMNPLPDAT